MPKPLRYLFIVLALIGLCFAIWTGTPRRPQATEEGVAPQAVVPSGAMEHTTSPELAASSGERIETAPELGVTAVAPAANDQPASLITGVAKLTARFVDKLGNPWPDVRVVDADFQNLSATSDSTGRFELEIPQRWSETSWSGEFVARRRGCATKQLVCAMAVGSTSTLGDVVLEPGVDVHGRTVDETGEGISVRVGKSLEAPGTTESPRRRHIEQLNLDSRLTVTSDNHGEFRLEGLSVGDTYLWAKGAETRMAWSEKLTLVEGVDLLGLIVTVPRYQGDELITGVVLTPDGEPAKRASLFLSFVSEARSGATEVRVGSDGRFVIEAEPERPVYEIRAVDLEQRYSDALLRDVKPGARDVELRLAGQPPIRVVLRGPAGEPVDEVSMRITRDTGAGVWMGAPARTKSVGEGAHELVVPTTRFQLEIDAVGYAKYKSGDLEPPAPGSTLEIQLDRPSLLRGRVLAEGQPAAGARVRSFKDASNDVLRVSGFRSLHTPSHEAEAITTDDGTFELPYEGNERLWLRVDIAGFAAAELGAFAPTASPELAFELVRGGVIEGVVILPNGADAEGTVVGVSRCDGFPRTQRAGPGGRFRFEGLTPGPWQVLQRKSEFDPQSMSYSTTRGQGSPIEWSCEVRDGRTTRFDLDLSRP